MKIYQTFVLIAGLLPVVLSAQQIAIIDQGINTGLTNNGNFYNPLCYPANESWLHARGRFPVSVSDINAPSINTTLLNGDQVAIFTIDLCSTKHTSGLLLTSANVPRFRSLPLRNRFNQPYTRVALTNSYVIPRMELISPYQSIVFGDELKHGTHVANAAHEFNPNVQMKMIQVYNIGDRKEFLNDCSATPSRTITRNTGVIGGSQKILDALKDIANSPDGVDAVNLSIVFRQGYCQRQQGNVVPQLCSQKIGQTEVDNLAKIGIPLIVGLENKNIGKNEVTWPACLDGVIKVGAENDNDNVGGEIGVGGMAIDFFAKNTVRANNPIPGNSLAAPRIATAFAMLKDAVPSSTIGDRILALNTADSLRNTYRFNNTNYTARHIKPNQIAAAVEKLEEIVRGNSSEIGFSDTNEYGPTYGGNESNYSFEVDFDDLIASNKLNFNSSSGAKTTTVSPVRDVVLSFDAKMSNLSNGFEIFINGTKRETTNTFTSERSFEFTFKRTLFASGKNTIRIEPRLDRPWGLTNIKAEFTPVVELTLNQVDRTQYGSEEDPERPTGLRASFQLADTENNVLFSVTGWDVTDTDEVAVYLNGIDYGFLSKRASVFDTYSPQDSFVFKKTDLSEGQNTIEFVQKAGASKWGVTNMFVALDSLAPVLPLGIRNTQKYGNNYGTNEHPVNLDFTFSPISEHDHKISWQGFDIDQDLTRRYSDVDVFLNGRLIKKLAATANNQLGSAETITLASRMFSVGVNTLSFRVNGNAQDTTWGITNILVDTSAIIDLDDETNLEKDYGYYAKYRGPVPSGWTRNYSTQDYQTRLYATFNSTATQDKLFQITGWDIDSPEELAIYVNGSFLQYVNSEEASSIYSDPQIVTIPKSKLIAGRNTISFRTNILTGFNNEKWGVFFGRGLNITVAPIIMLLLDDD